MRGIDLACALRSSRPAWMPAFILGLMLGVAGDASAQSPQFPDWEATLAAAKKEGKVTFYSDAASPVGDRLVAGFRKKYPDIAIESFRATSGTLLPRLEQERNSGSEGGDVLLTSEFLWLEERLKEGVLLSPRASTVGQWPARFVRHGGIYVGGVEPLIIIYDKRRVTTPPKSYADLLSPEYKDKLGTSGIAATAIVAFYDWAEKTFGSDYLVRLRAQNPKLYNGGTPLSQAVASGEIIASGIAAVPANAKALMAAGAPIDYVVPNPGIGIAYAPSALGWSKRPNAARVLADYILSTDGQIAWHSRGESASPLAGIEGSLDASTITPWDPDAYPPAVVKAFSERFKAIF